MNKQHILKIVFAISPIALFLLYIYGMIPTFEDFLVVNLIFIIFFTVSIILSIYAIIEFFSTVRRLTSTINSDANICLETQKGNYFYYSSQTRIFQYRKSFILSKEHKIDKIVEIGLIKDDEIITTVKSGAAMSKVVAGGILFGGWGAIAGALVGGSKSSQKKVHSYAIEITIDDITNPGVVLDAGRDGFFELISLFKVLELQEKHEK